MKNCPRCNVEIIEININGNLFHQCNETTKVVDISQHGVELLYIDNYMVGIGQDGFTIIRNYLKDKHPECPTARINRIVPLTLSAQEYEQIAINENMQNFEVYVNEVYKRRYGKDR